MLFFLHDLAQVFLRHGDRDCLLGRDLTHVDLKKLVVEISAVYPTSHYRQQAHPGGSSSHLEVGS